jgi:hypothetical protein
MTRKELDQLVDEYQTTLEKFIEGLNVVTSKQIKNSANDNNLQLLMEYYGFMAYLSQEPDMEKASEWARLMYMKTMGDLYATYTLLRQGSNYQAMEVLRSQTETALTAKYISLDPTTRGPLFVNHKYIEDYFLAPDTNKPQYEADYLLHKVNYDVNETEGYSFGWYQKNMQDFIRGDALYGRKRPSIKLMAQIGGLGALYDSVYSLGSGFTHGSSQLKSFLNSTPGYDKNKTKFIAGITLKLITVVVESIITAENITTHAYGDLHAAVASKLSGQWG